MLARECRWIWIAGNTFGENEYIDIRKTFNLDKIDADAKLHICVDTDYVAWINGRWAGCGQFGDLPTHRHYDTLMVGSLLQSGQNVLTLTCYYQGKDSSRYRAGLPGVAFSLHHRDRVIVSDLQMRARLSPAFQSGPMPWVTPQLGYTIGYDARGDDHWRQDDYDDSHWSAVAALPKEQVDPTTYAPRPVAKLMSCAQPATKVLKAGRLHRQSKSGSFAAVMAGDRLDNEIIPPSMRLLHTETPAPLELELDDPNGAWVLLDLEQECFGWFHLDIDAPAGTVVDIAHGEHIADGLVRYYFNGGGDGEGSIERNFADRYVCRQGRQSWTMYFRRLGARYLQLHLTGSSGTVTLHYAGIRPLAYPVVMRGTFQCDDEKHHRILTVAERTLRLCMHEHYEDTPWREQALYAMDGRLQSLCGYYLYGDYDFPRESIRLLGRNMGPRGFLELTAPGKVPITIPSFSLAWILMVRDYHLFSGRTDVLDEFMPQIKQMLQCYHKRRDANGLYPVEQGSEFWNFYEWSPGLDENGAAIRTKTGRYHACFDAFLIMATEAVGQLCANLGDPDGVELRAMLPAYCQAMQRTYWDKQNGLFRNHSGHKPGQPFNQLTQALALNCGLLTPQETARFVDAILHHQALTPVTLSMLYYVMDAVMQASPHRCIEVYDLIAKTWGNMLDHGAGTFWETIKGHDDFDGAGSLCHGWSAVPVYFYFAYGLGVRPLTPGFAQFTVAPLPGKMGHARGVIPCPYGTIGIDWTRQSAGEYQVQLSHPQETKPHLDRSRSTDVAWHMQRTTASTISLAH